MKRKYILRLFGVCITILLFPVVMRYVIQISTFLLQLFKLQPLILITDTFELSFNNYITLTVSLIACICSGYIGYITYQLSISIRAHSLQQEKQKTVFISRMIIHEINSNCKIIKSCEDKVTQNHKEIELEGELLLEKSNLNSPSSLIDQLIDLYAMFSQYKKQGVLLSADKEKWLDKDNTVKIESLMNQLNELGR